MLIVTGAVAAIGPGIGTIQGPSKHVPMAVVRMRDLVVGSRQRMVDGTNSGTIDFSIACCSQSPRLDVILILMNRPRSKHGDRLFAVRRAEVVLLAGGPGVR